MTMNDELNPIADNQPEPSEAAEANPVAHSVMARAGQGQRLLSPWVQRHLLASVRTPTSKPGQPALTLSGTTSLLNRLQRTTDKSRVWQPNVGSLNPRLVNNFTNTIVHRFAEPGAKDEAPAPRL